jgi:hypothetical protein
MRILICCLVGVLVSAARLPSSKSAAPIVGDYVEARTASVFAGACHYNSELVTAGQEAVAAWSFTGGAWHGVDLAGVRAAAAIGSEFNLGQEHAARKTELVIDSGASEAQAEAVASLLKEKCGDGLGQIVSVKRALVKFTHAAGEYAVKVEGFATMSVQPMPDNACCAQPNLVWYSPLTPVEHRKVGFTKDARFAGGSVSEPWQREGENSAFYGSFSW